MLVNSLFKSTLLAAGAIGLAMTSMMLPAAAEDDNTSVSQWQGAYIGAHIGSGFGTIDGLGALAGINASDDMSGFTGGVLAGWNFTQDNWVFGLEADASLGSIDGSIVVLGVNVTEEIQWQGNFRARVGYLVSPDVLAFAAGGLALANYDIKTNSIIAGNDSQTFVGWTIGGGLEASLDDKWKARIEYLYTDYGSETMFTTVGGGVDVSPKQHTIRAAIIMNF